MNKIQKNKSENIGIDSQIIGPVVDVTFENIMQGLPDIYDSLVIKKENGDDSVVDYYGKTPNEERQDNII